MQRNGRVFFSKALDDVVVDSQCECGHTEREHGSELKRLPSGKPVRLDHSGSCCCGNCTCRKFRFEKFVTADEAADKLERQNRKELVGV